MRRGTRRRYLKSIGIGSAIGMAGCLNNRGDGNSSGGGGNSSGGSGNSNGNPLKLGLLAPYEHPNGQSIIRGAESAVQDINDNGGVLDRKVKLIQRDTKLSTQTSIEETRSLLNQENVDFLAGGYTSENTLAIQNQVAGSGPVFMNGGSASPRMAQRVKDEYEKYKYFFKSNLSSPYYAQGIVDLFKQVIKPAMDVSSAVVMAEDLTWSKPVAPTLSETLPEIGVEMAKEIRFPTDTSDYSTLYSKAINTGADVIIPVQSVAGATPVTQWWDQQIPMPMYGILGQARASTFYKDVSGKCMSTVTNLQGADAPITKNTKDWVSRFQQQHSQKPVGVAFTTYDGLRALFQAIKSAGTTNDSPVISELESLQRTGVSGTLSFQAPNSEYPHDPIYGIKDGLAFTFVQWQKSNSGDGSRPIIAPEAWAGSDGDQKLLMPPWMQ